MTNELVFGHPSCHLLANQMAAQTGYDLGQAHFDRFPDGESYVNIISPVKNKDLILVCTLNDPDAKLTSLLYFVYTARELGASSITLVAPYLAYMRQDKQSQPGEALSSLYFGRLLSTFFDRVITLEPHLHSERSLSDIFYIPGQALSAAPLINDWLLNNIQWPLLIGPDEASLKLINEVNRGINAPTAIFSKKRHTGATVSVKFQDLSEWAQYTPVIIDDIIATGHTMLETLKHIESQGLAKAICIGVHGIFADNAYPRLQNSHVRQIITTNSVQHETNSLDIGPLLNEAVTR